MAKRKGLKDITSVAQPPKYPVSKEAKLDDLKDIVLFQKFIHYNKPQTKSGLVDFFSGNQPNPGQPQDVDLNSWKILGACYSEGKKKKKKTAQFGVVSSSVNSSADGEVIAFIYPVSTTQVLELTVAGLLQYFLSR